MRLQYLRAVIVQRPLCQGNEFLDIRLNVMGRTLMTFCRQTLR